MKTVQSWLDEYAVCHQNPTNKAFHWVCVPLIVWSLLALLWLVPAPGLHAAPVPINLAMVTIAGISIYYAYLSWQLALGILIVIAGMLWLGVQVSQALQWPMWMLALAVFIVAWIGQFIGHHFEGKRPALFDDLRFLLIGPIWCLAHLFKKLGWSY